MVATITCIQHSYHDDGNSVFWLRLINRHHLHHALHMISITLPVYNEEQALGDSVEKLISFLRTTKFPYEYEIVIADNASTDRTPDIARDLVKKHSQIKYLHIPKKGRGLALREAWRQTRCDIACYFDIDLSTDLVHLLPLIDAICDGAVVATGSRLDSSSVVTGRTSRREILSRGYNHLIRLFFRTPFKDAQCGFKAVNTDYFRKIEGLIENNHWFFDTELLLLTNYLKEPMVSIPVHWIDDSSTTVKVLGTVGEDIKGLLRLRRGFFFDDRLRRFRASWPRR